ncbi:DeoR family transcriptional regulator [uncultured Robinsoniella sp.]|uniref:DeoR family transcriptional regulator n=1 Tax=uncultured Robinsoniella sp. TaxID=904190 RepID=UPI00374EB48F
MNMKNRGKAVSLANRREQIAKILLVEGKTKVGDLARRFEVSTETIRKDLMALDASGIIKKNNGSAEVLNESSANNYTEKSKKAINEKVAIAQRAVKLIPDKSVVFLDTGSTVYQLARQLILRKDITVVCTMARIGRAYHRCLDDKTKEWLGSQVDIIEAPVEGERWYDLHSDI